MFEISEIKVIKIMDDSSLEMYVRESDGGLTYTKIEAQAKRFDHSLDGQWHLCEAIRLEAEKALPMFGVYVVDEEAKHFRIEIKHQDADPFYLAEVKNGFFYYADGITGALPVPDKQSDYLVHFLEKAFPFCLVTKTELK